VFLLAAAGFHGAVGYTISRIGIFGDGAATESGVAESQAAKCAPADGNAGQREKPDGKSTDGNHAGSDAPMAMKPKARPPSAMTPVARPPMAMMP